MSKPTTARVLLLILALAALAPMLSACNTTAGVGQDVSATGRAVSRGANSVRQGL